MFCYEICKVHFKSATMDALSSGEGRQQCHLQYHLAAIDLLVLCSSEVVNGKVGRDKRQQKS